MAVTFQRVLSDDELHKRVRAAFGSGRKVYTRVGSDRDIGRIATRFRNDKNAQEALRAFVDDLIAASGHLREKPKKRRQWGCAPWSSSAAPRVLALSSQPRQGA